MKKSKVRLAYDTDDKNSILDIYIKAAENAVLNYVTDTFEGGLYPDVFKQAVLFMIDIFDENSELTITDNYLPAPVRALLYPYRTPTII